MKTKILADFQISISVPLREASYYSDQQFLVVSLPFIYPISVVMGIGNQ